MVLQKFDHKNILFLFFSIFLGTIRNGLIARENGALVGYTSFPVYIITKLVVNVSHHKGTTSVHPIATGKPTGSLWLQKFFNFIRILEFIKAYPFLQRKFLPKRSLVCFSPLQPPAFHLFHPKLLFIHRRCLDKPGTSSRQTLLNGQAKENKYGTF